MEEISGKGPATALPVTRLSETHGSGILPVIVNLFNWKVTYQISLMTRLIAFEFSYASVEMDFD